MGNEAQYVVCAQPHPDQTHRGLGDFLTFLPALQFNYILIMLLVEGEE